MGLNKFSLSPSVTENSWNKLTLCLKHHTIFWHYFWKWLKQGHYGPKKLNYHFTIIQKKLFNSLHPRPNQCRNVKPTLIFDGGGRSWTGDSWHGMQALYQLSYLDCLFLWPFSEELLNRLGSRRACFSHFQKNTCEKAARRIRTELRLFQPYSTCT